MKKHAKVAIALVAGVTAAVMGIATGCGGGHKHKLEWDYDTTGHWQYCTEDDYTTTKEAHKDADSDGKCDVCKATIQTASHTHTYTEWGSNDTQHWKYCADDNVIDESTRANHSYTNGKCACGKDDPNASQGGETTGKNEYTIYLYAPEADGAVTISVWGGMAGAFNDGSTMTAVTGSAGWYSFTFKTDKEIADGANFNLYVGGEQVATGYTTAADWVYFVSGKNDIKWNSMADAEAAYNGGGTVTPEPGETETTTVYFHRPTEWEGAWVGVHAYYDAANTGATGDWGSTHMTEDSDGWYKVEIELPEGTENFNIILFDENDTNNAQIRKTLNVTNGIGANVYVNAKGKAFTDKDAALADEDENTPKAYSYTFYMYAPDASSVTIGVWGNFNGEIADGTPMTAVDGHDGWYSYTLATDIQIKAGNGINLNIFVDGENKGKYSENETDLYFIAAGNDRGFTNFDDAEAKYAELTAPVDPSDIIQVAIHFQAPTGWTLTGALGLHAWGATGDLTGGWGSTTMTAEGDGWYTVTISVVKVLIGESINFIFFDVNNNNESTGAGRVNGSLTLAEAGVWVDSTGATVANPNA